MITKSEKKKIIFFFPFRGYGGVPVVFLNIAKYLQNSSPALNIAVVDYADGYMAKNIGDSGVELIIFSRNELLHFGEQDLVIFQSLPLTLLVVKKLYIPS